MWLDNRSLNFELKIETTENKSLNDILKEIMIKIGATEDILNTKCVAICGPTGVGKTKFINNIKTKFNSEVINMDTMQVYSGISIGSGRTNLANTRGSHLYGVYDPNTQFHILDYLSDVFKAIDKIKENKNKIIFEGASKSLLDVIRLIFPNLVIFGIEAINEGNISSNIKKRITPKIVKKAILELSQLLKLDSQPGGIKFDSPVLKNNPEVYNLILLKYTDEELKDINLDNKLINNINNKTNKLTLLTEEIIEANINLHKKQYARLKEIDKIKWFKNDDGSVVELEKAYLNVYIMPEGANSNSPDSKSILSQTNDFDFINTDKCSSIADESCEVINDLFHSADSKIAIEFSAKLNIPLFPNDGSKQIVLGTTKYLLPYTIFPSRFNMFAIKPENWTEERNLKLIQCIADRHIENNIIRLVTTPSNLIDEKHTYRITAKEICILRKNNYNFYKYDSEEFTNVYFCSKEPLGNCTIVDVDPSKGVFRCKNKDIELYF